MKFSSHTALIRFRKWVKLKLIKCSKIIWKFFHFVSSIQKFWVFDNDTVRLDRYGPTRRSLDPWPYSKNPCLIDNSFFIKKCFSKFSLVIKLDFKPFPRRLNFGFRFTSYRFSIFEFWMTSVIRYFLISSILIDLRIPYIFIQESVLYLAVLLYKL